METDTTLDSALLRSDETRALLRVIDQSILKIGDDTQPVDIENLFLKSFKEFCRLHGLSKAPNILVFMGEEFRPLRRSRGSKPVFPITSTLRRFCNGSRAIRRVEFEEDPELFDSGNSENACLIAPLYTANCHLLCLLVARAGSVREAKRLCQSDLRQGLEDLSAQLTIAYGQYERARFHTELRDLWGAFLDHNLSPTVCFQTLAERIPRFLPKFGPLGAIASTAPHVQILMLPKASNRAPRPKHLVIRGTTGAEHSGTRVAIDRSISGKLITDPSLRLFCGDPTAKEHRGLYKDYFGDPRQRARTELAVRMKARREIIGIINVESRYKDAFAYLQRQTLLELADTFGRLAAVLEERLAMNTRMQNSVATSTRNYLDALASTFRHGMATPLAAQELDADSLGVMIGQAGAVVEEMSRLEPRVDSLNRPLQSLRQLLSEMDEAQRDLAATRDEAYRYSEDFVNDISGYAEEGQIVLREIVESARQLAINSLLARKAQHTMIKVVHDSSLPTTRIYCSTLIKQHFYSIFHNAVDAIRKRLQADRRRGQITVSISEEKIPEGQEKRLNKAWVVRIRDNGLGVSAAQLRDLQKFEPGITFKPGGHGYGLTAAQRYVASIGGRIELDSKRGKFFEVALYLDEYNPAIHGNIQRLENKGGLYGQAAEGTYRRG